MKKNLLLLLTFLSLNVAFAQQFIDNGVTYNVTSPTTVEVVESDPEYTGDITIPIMATDIGDGEAEPVEYTVTGIASKAFSECSTLNSISILADITYIGSEAFKKCYALGSIEIPGTVNDIGTKAFNECTGLTAITFAEPSQLTEIKSETFYKCTSLQEIHIPEGVETIGSKAFSRCEVATAITIPNTVTSIGVSAFDQCKLVTEITIPDGITTIENGTFYKCYALETIVIPESVTSIGDDAFGQDDELINITIPEAVTSIGEKAFFKCRSIPSISLSENITSIGANAFEYLDELTSFSIGVANPADITLGTNVFINTDIGIEEAGITLDVPSGSKTAYEAALQWGDFFTISDSTLSTNESILESSFSVYPNPVQNTLFIQENASYKLDQVRVYNVQGKLVLSSYEHTIDVTSLAKGIYFVKISTNIGSTTKKLIKN